MPAAAFEPGRTAPPVHPPGLPYPTRSLIQDSRQENLILPRKVTVIRVLLGGDVRLVRGALAALLSREPDIDVIGELTVGPGLVPLATRLRPDVLVINADLSTSLVLPAVAELRAQPPGFATVVLTDSRCPAVLPWATHERTLSFLVKDAPPALLADTVRRVADGHRVVDPRIAVASLVEAASPLTTRELEVLGLAAQGTPVPEIANQMYLALGTVRNYLSAVIAKTGARNRIDAIRIAREAGWLM
jgi:two-component system, NarL family, response regulator DesR